MVSYPTILGLPQDKLNRQLYIRYLENVRFDKSLDVRVKALEDTPVVSTGTVTVTTVDAEDTPIEAEVFMATQALDDVANFETWFATYGVGMGTTENGECTLTHFDPETFQPTSDTSFEYGTYYILAMHDNDFNMNYELTVDGDETVTITITQE